MLYEVLLDMFPLILAVLIFVVNVTIFPGGTGNEIGNQYKDEEVRVKFNSLADQGIKCETGNCGLNKCNCCSGYRLSTKSGWFGDTYSCKKCNCGKDFNCTYEGFYGGVKCFCPEGFSEENRFCKADCKTNPCKNGGTCQVKGDDVACVCKDLYSGDRCEINKCSKIKCQNGGKCIIKEGKPSCDCTEHYTGKFCETEKCSSTNCQNNGRCVVKNDKPTCVCPPQYTGTNCEIDVCSLIECRNGRECYIENGKALCKCFGRLIGDKCENDKCSIIACQNGGECNIENGTASCKCIGRFTGDRCEIDKCSLIACQNGGECYSENGKAFCKCFGRFIGDKCEIDKCSLIACQNGGECKIEDGKAFCKCIGRFTGHRCEIDKCSLDSCQNGGECYSENGAVFCKCFGRFTGDRCEIELSTLPPQPRTTTGTIFSTSSIPGKKECYCENGKCEERSGKIECICNPEYGLYKLGICKVCECGKGANCTFTFGGWFSSDKKTCICPNGFEEVNGMCVELSTVLPPSTTGKPI